MGEKCWESHQGVIGAGLTETSVAAFTLPFESGDHAPVLHQSQHNIKSHTDVDVDDDLPSSSKNTLTQSHIRASTN